MEGKEKRVVWAVFGGVCLLAVFIVHRAVWMNIWGLLTAVVGIFPIIGYTLSPTSDPTHLSTYEPLNVFESWFNGARMEMVTRDVLTGTDVSSLTDFSDYFRYEKEIRAVCWSSLTVWLLFVLLILFSVKLAKRRRKKHVSVTVPILIGWTFLMLVPYICTVTVETAGSINAAHTFYAMSLCALTFFLIVWNYDTKSVTEKIGAVEELKVQASEEFPPEGWYTCSICGSLVRDGNRCSRCAGEASVPEEPFTPVEAGTEEEKEEKPAARYCRKCGAPLLPEGSFCTRCGAKIISE